MKKGWKIFWIVCAAASVIGLGCCAAAFTLGVTAEMIEQRLPHGVGIISRHTNPTDYLDEDGENITYAKDIHEKYKDITNLDVEVFAGEIQVVASDEANVEVVTEGLHEKLGFKCYTEGNKLCITTKKNLWHVDGAGIGTITIKVPKEMKFQEAEFSIDAGNLNIEAISAQNLDIDVKAGEAGIDRFEADEIDLDCGTGSITGDGSVIRELNADCGIGNIQLTLDGRENDYNYDIDCGIGDVICGENEFSGVGAEKRIDNQASKIINIDCGVGSVEVNFKEAL